MRRALAVTTMAAAVGLAGCGGTPSGSDAASGGSGGGSTGNGGQSSAASPMKVVQAAYGKTTKTKTAKLTLSTVTGTSQSKKRTSGQGAVNFAKDTTKLTMQVPGNQSLQIRKVGGVVYLKPPPQGQKAVPGKRTWLTIDMSKSQGKKKGAILGQDAPTNPSRRLNYLRGVSEVSKVGTTTIDGTKTTHYKGKVNLDKVAKKVGPKQQQSIKQLQKTLATKKLPLELWIDNQGRVRRQKVNVTFETPNGKTVTNTTTVNYSDFGKPVKVSAPPKGETQPLKEVVQKMKKKRKQQGQG